MMPGKHTCERCANRGHSVVVTLGELPHTRVRDADQVGHVLGADTAVIDSLGDSASPTTRLTLQQGDVLVVLDDGREALTLGHGYSLPIGIPVIPGMCTGGTCTQTLVTRRRVPSPWRRATLP